MLCVISAIATALVAALGGYFAAQQILTIGVVVAFLNYARQFFNAVSQLSSLYSETQSALAGGERVFELLDTPVARRRRARTRASWARSRAHRVPGRALRLRARAPRSSTASTSSFPQVETVAIVGATGAGKTTLVNLVPRFYDPTGGAVLIDGHDLRDVGAALRCGARSASCLQDPFLFSGTIADNIRYGDLDATDEEVREARESRERSTSSNRSPRASTRASASAARRCRPVSASSSRSPAPIVGDPAILILDEATSSVDTRTELLIQPRLRSILEGRTALIIAHRLSTVRDADRIVVRGRRRIVEDGTYATLLAAGGAFAALHEAQFSAS